MSKLSSKNSFETALFGYILAGDNSAAELSASRLKPEYFSEPFFSDLFSIFLELQSNSQSADCYTMNDAFLRGDKKKVKQRLFNARTFFKDAGQDVESEKSIKQELLNFLTSCSVHTSSGFEVPTLVNHILNGYKESRRQELYSEYAAECKRKLGDTTALTYTFTEALHELDKLGTTDILKRTLLDLNELKHSPDSPPLLYRDDVGLIYKENLHMVSGTAGSMKTLFCYCLAAAALNDGLSADLTLGIYSSKEKLKVAYIDTELVHSTVKRRLPFLETINPNRSIFDKSRFSYISLKDFTKQERKREIINLIPTLDADLIIVDGLRDICFDFNDIAEATELAETFKKLAESTQKAIIVTSHTSKTTSFSRGHLGSQFNDVVGLEVSLTKYSQQIDNFPCVKVSYNKSRHDSLNPFSMRFNSNLNYLEVIHQEPLKNSSQKLLKYFTNFMQPSKTYRYKALVEGLKKQSIPESTAKNYIKKGSGIVLIHSGNEYWLKSDPTFDFDDDDDLPED